MMLNTNTKNKRYMITYCAECNRQMNDDGFLSCKICRKKKNVVVSKNKNKDDVDKLINMFGLERKI